ncbi:hypothetical protein Ahy_B06g085796 [Arachis hypogaea]|uniref:Sacsin/Nov domain-containing protein n=1 Tax=Arachis hypogaea TaxID=3818 RepID=A0A444YVR2_ARAHY|nr:hypothetical protein Ahy_B06g085796 [Arachis hypogaea]
MALPSSSVRHTITQSRTTITVIAAAVTVSPRLQRTLELSVGVSLDRLTSSKPSSTSSIAANDGLPVRLRPDGGPHAPNQDVLVNYLEGTTVLKELIQNANDAGATTVSLCLDCHFHRCDSLITNTLVQWQGPAVLAYNDTVFTKEDFVNISMIGGSSKHGQTWKTGRFGVFIFQKFWRQIFGSEGVRVTVGGGRGSGTERRCGPCWDWVAENIEREGRDNGNSGGEKSNLEILFNFLGFR